MREKEQIAGISGQTAEVSNIIEDTQSDFVTLSLRRPKRDLATKWEPSL